MSTWFYCLQGSIHSLEYKDNKAINKVNLTYSSKETDKSQLKNNNLWLSASDANNYLNKNFNRYSRMYSPNELKEDEWNKTKDPNRFHPNLLPFNMENSNLVTDKYSEYPHRPDICPPGYFFVKEVYLAFLILLILII